MELSIVLAVELKGLFQSSFKADLLRMTSIPPPYVRAFLSRFCLGMPR